MPKSAPDILVIGGGVIGLVTAFTLRKAGFDVGLIERRRIASGASGWAGGIVRSLHADEEDVARAIPGLRTMRDLRRAIGIDIPFHETGYIHIPPGDHPDNSDPRTEAEADNGAPPAPPGIRRLVNKGAVIWQDRATLRARYPGFAAIGSGAWLEPTAGWADPRLICLAYGQAFSRIGGMLIEGTRVERIRASCDGVSLTTSMGEMHTQHVVLALGDGLPAFLDGHGVRHRFYVKPIEVGLFAPAVPILAPCFTDDTCDIYGKPDLDGGCIHVGHSLGRHAGAEPGSTPVDADHIAATRLAAAPRLPWIARAGARGGARHAECFHESKKPVVAPLDAEHRADADATRIIVAGGFSGTGIRMAPWAADRTLQLIRDRRNG